MKAIESALSNLKIGEPIVSGGMAVFPVFHDNAAPMQYLLLDDALEGKLAHVTEVSESGHVPELFFENASGKPVLLVDGDELVGARQNRIVNITILVGAGKKLVIPVSCVEQGRWAYQTRGFSSAGRALFASARAKKMSAVSESLRHERGRMGDQGEIWQDIQMKMAERSVVSDTSAMCDLYESLEPEMRRAESHFTVQPGQTGAVFVSGGRVAGIEFFDAPEAFAKCFAKTVRAYEMDAPAEATSIDPKAALADVQHFLKEMIAASTEQYEALGEGSDVRLAGEHVSGGALVNGERVVHLAAYRGQTRV
jgi:hypothetical protein